MTDEEIKNFKLKLQEANRAKEEAIRAFLAAESRLVAALIQQGQEQYEDKGIVYGCRVIATNFDGRDCWTGIYVGHRGVYGSRVEPSVMKETKYGRPHKSARVLVWDQDWRLAND
jgi:hypothetical protein